VIFYPAVGLGLGIISAVVLFLCRRLGFASEATSFCLIIIPYVCTNFLHFDGLCDVFDGFLADKGPEERLRIMKDSSIGSFALGSGVLFLLIRFFSLRACVRSSGFVLLYVMLFSVLSRYVPVMLSYKAHYPRSDGTASFLVGKISTVYFLLSTGLAAVLTTALVLAGAEKHVVLILISTAVISALVLRQAAYCKICGVTGDVLGAGVEVTECALGCAILLLL